MNKEKNDLDEGRKLGDEWLNFDLKERLEEERKKEDDSEKMKKEPPKEL